VILFKERICLMLVLVLLAIVVPVIVGVIVLSAAHAWKTEIDSLLRRIERY
jgi:hypothetical protein